MFLDRDPRNTVDIDWLLGHQDIKGNGDELAKAAAEMWWANATTTLTQAKRAAKEKGLARWMEKLKKTYPTGRFGPADRIPPAWKPRATLD
ncbi:hypothetical protein C8R43DRAFT_204754 [Mycena crocata]|nr:hypothetical protein C8R43DRAFT_204754 [Mycena crocata]